MAALSYTIRTSVFLVAGSPTFGEFCIKPVRIVAFTHAASSRLPSILGTDKVLTASTDLFCD